MALHPSRMTLAAGTVILAVTLLGVVAVGLTAARSPARVAFTIAALLVLAAAMLEPFRLLRAARS